MDCLDIFEIELGKKWALSLIILRWIYIWLCWVASIHTSNSFQYFFISDLSKIGCFVIYLLVAFKTESTFLFDSTRNGLFKFWNLETCSVSEMILPLHNVTLLLVIILFEKFVLANLQKYWLTFKEAYSFFFHFEVLMKHSNSFAFNKLTYLLK